MKCEYCKQGVLVGSGTCNSCGHSLPLDELLKYSNLSFLLAEAKTENWQLAIKPDQNEKLFRPYELAQRESGLKLGFIAPTDQKILFYKYLTLLYFIKDLEALGDETLPLSDRSRLLAFIHYEKKLLEIEYNFFSKSPPSFMGISINWKSNTR